MSKHLNLLTGVEQNGVAPFGEGWVVLYSIDVYPEPRLYPKNFYYGTSNIPVRDLAANPVTDTMTYALKSVEVIQSELLKSLKAKRDLRLFGEVTVGEVTIIIANQRDVDLVTSLGDVPIKFKRGTGDRVVINESDGVLFRKAYKSQVVQAAFDWEEAEEGKVTAAITHSKLEEYLNEMG